MEQSNLQLVRIIYRYSTSSASINSIFNQGRKEHSREPLAEWITLSRTQWLSSKMQSDEIHRLLTEQLRTSHPRAYSIEIIRIKILRSQGKFFSW